MNLSLQRNAVIQRNRSRWEHLQGEWLRPKLFEARPAGVTASKHFKALRFKAAALLNLAKPQLNGQAALPCKGACDSTLAQRTACAFGNWCFRHELSSVCSVETVVTRLNGAQTEDTALMLVNKLRWPRLLAACPPLHLAAS